MSVTSGQFATHHPVVIEHVSHTYGAHRVYDDLSLTFERGKVYALLGKNGVGKTTLIKILMGFLQPCGGTCRIFGNPSFALEAGTRARIGLLFEKYLAYDFLSIEQIEKFYGNFYPQWEPRYFYDMVDRLSVPYSRIIATLSEGQRSQVVLGLLLAQCPELLILDDYSMGLDAGYRRLFIDYLAENFKDGSHTVILTSHVIQDMDGFVDEIIFLKRGGQTFTTSLHDFKKKFRRYRIGKQEGVSPPVMNGQDIVNVEEYRTYWDVFSFAHEDRLRKALLAQGVVCDGMHTVDMTLEDAFIGYTGRY